LALIDSWTLCLPYFAAEPLTEQEQEQKQDAMKLGFEDWTRRDYQQFVKGVEQYGKSVHPHFG